jgi:deazaflavin-dependent oxidoreductase (nitroreductase family)
MSSRPLLGLRTQPGRLALAVMRWPRALYRHRLGRLLGHTFLLIAHRGRTTGRRRETVVMALDWDAKNEATIVCSAWGETEWVKNLRAHPAAEIQIGGDRFAPEQRFLSEAESVEAVRAFRRRHPWRMKLFTAVFDWGDLSTERAIQRFVSGRPFVAFRRASHNGRDCDF